MSHPAKILIVDDEEVANAAMLHKRWALHSEADSPPAAGPKTLFSRSTGRASDKPDFARKLP